MPGRDEQRFTHTPARGYERTPAEAERAYEQAVKQRWRAMALIVKAKLEAVEAGIVTADDEWLAYTLLPDGRTVAEHTQPAVTEAYETGSVPALLPALRPQLPAGGGR